LQRWKIAIMDHEAPAANQSNPTITHVEGSRVTITIEITVIVIILEVSYSVGRSVIAMGGEFRVVHQVVAEYRAPVVVDIR
jgi:hypothetical protein